MVSGGIPGARIEMADATTSTISFRSPALREWNDTGGDLLRHCRWQATTPAELKAAAATGDVVQFGTIWRRSLRDRRQADRPQSLELHGLWSPLEHVSQPVASTLAPRRETLRHRGVQRPAIKPKKDGLASLQPLITALSRDDAVDGLTADELLLALEILWTRGDQLPQTQWWPIWQNSLRALLNFLATPLAAELRSDEQLLQQGELPLLGGLVFADLAGSRELRARGQRVLQRELKAQVDTDGTPHSELLPRLAYWLAPLVRATGWCRQTGQSFWDEDQRLLLSDVIEKAVALCRPNGRFALTTSAAVNALPMLRQAAIWLEWPPSSPGAQGLAALASHQDRSRSARGTSAVGIMPSNQSDWARFALLRSDWTGNAACFAVTHHRPLPQLDFTVHGRPILHGDWGLDLRLGDAAVELADEWNCVCWESQPEVDYIELQMSGPGKLHVERFILLSREDQFLMMADAVRGAPADRVALQSRVPLADDVVATWEAGRRAMQLTAGAAKVRLLPLLFPADTVDSSPHTVREEDGCLVWEYLARGQGLFAPLVFDFHPQRLRKPVIWKPLTVTEDTAVVSRDVAAAYRWQIGREQWLVYRSQRKARLPRAALGHHTANGLVVGRFDKQGDVDTILAVEE